MLAKAGNARVDQLGVVLLEGIEVDAQATGHAGAEVLHDDVGVTHQLIQAGQVRGRLEVHFDTALAAIDQAEINAFAILERAQVAAVITVPRHFELDDVGAEVRQHGGAVGAGQYAAQVQYANAL
ncbi:hypothetical protein D3C73_1355670 [compost metagenome]